MAEKRIYGRAVQKHDFEKNWIKATNFIPMAGEIIVYDRDDNVTDESLKGNYSYERIKIGDGIQNVNVLPFVDDAVKAEVAQVSGLIGGTAVSTQISTAIDEATADDFGIYVQASEPVDAIVGDIWIDTVNDPSYIPPTLPEITEADNGKVLMVVNGRLQLVSLNLSVDANGVVYM